MPVSLASVLVFSGSALMAYNVACFLRFARLVRERDVLGERVNILYVPIALLVLFLAGYLVVGLCGQPDLVVSLILLGGSLFVYIIYRMLDHITRRIIESEQLKAELLAVEESNRAKSTFLASMSHEMRTPLNIILGLQTLALTNEDVPELTRDQLERIGASARHLLGIINNILLINETDTSSLALEREELSLAEDVVGQVSSLAKALCANKGLTFEAHLDERVAERYVGDGTKLKQVLMGLLENAAKYTDAPGHVSLSVEVAKVLEWAEPPMHRLRFVVSDTGVGMDQAFVPHLFEAFAQEDASTTNRYGGSGLSLAVAKGNVDLMGGAIEVTSAKGKGSTFVVSVPLEVVSREHPSQESVSLEDARGTSAAPEPASPEHDESRPGSETADLSSSDACDGLLEGLCVLVVEDIEDNAEIVADLLDLEGATSEHAINGKVAVDLFVESVPYHFDAVLMDLRMPVMDGFEATREIRALDREDAASVPIIALTANAFNSDVRECLDAGMDAHLAKPADADELYRTIGRLVLARNKNERDATPHPA